MQLQKKGGWYAKKGQIFDVEVKIKKFAENRVFVIAEDITRLKQLEIELYEC